MKVALTGCRGFLGSEIAKYFRSDSSIELIQNDIDIGGKSFNAGMEGNYLLGDIRRRDICETLLKDTDVLVHMAQSNNPFIADSDWVGDIEQNLIPTLTILDSVKSREKQLHIIFPSSGGTVYAPHQDESMFNENDQCFAFSPYGAQKILLENYLSIMTKRNPQISVTILRISNPYGVLLPIERKQGFIGVSLNKIKLGLPVEVWGNPENVRDYIHINDLCSSFSCALKETSRYEVFNIGSGEGHSVTELLDIFRLVLERDIDIKTIQSSAADAMPTRSVLDIARARDKLRWEPTVKLIDGIKEIVVRNAIK
ncbi:MAG: NAD-dependent epimerase/dehydratase family protein [Rectinemataceae bacterium]|jgi:UDP-glucose 4-epimerase